MQTALSYFTTALVVICNSVVTAYLIWGAYLVEAGLFGFWVIAMVGAMHFGNARGRRSVAFDRHVLSDNDKGLAEINRRLDALENALATPKNLSN